MITDHYQLLNVPRDADLVTIHKAYRARAMESHPDHGGSHQAMLLVNEAFEILSNPESRRRYDEVLRNEADESTLVQAKADTRDARQKAENYPRDWKEFEGWLDALTKDFTNAKYGQEWIFPTVANSGSGCLFLLIGATAGGYLGYHFLTEGRELSGADGRGVVFAAAGGAFVAMWLHQAIGRSIQKPGTSTGSPTAAAPSSQTDTGNSTSSNSPKSALSHLCAQVSPRTWQGAELFSAGEIVICGPCGMRNRLPTCEAMPKARCGKCHARLLFSKAASGDKPA